MQKPRFKVGDTAWYLHIASPVFVEEVVIRDAYEDYKGPYYYPSSPYFDAQGPSGHTVAREPFLFTTKEEALAAGMAYLKRSRQIRRGRLKVAKRELKWAKEAVRCSEAISLEIDEDFQQFHEVCLKSGLEVGKFGAVKDKTLSESISQGEYLAKWME